MPIAQERGEGAESVGSNEAPVEDVCNETDDGAWNGRYQRLMKMIRFERTKSTQKRGEEDLKTTQLKSACHACLTQHVMLLPLLLFRLFSSFIHKSRLKAANYGLFGPELFP